MEKYGGVILREEGVRGGGLRLYSTEERWKSLKRLRQVVLKIKVANHSLLLSVDIRLRLKPSNLSSLVLHLPLHQNLLPLDNLRSLDSLLGGGTLPSLT